MNKLQHFEVSRDKLFGIAYRITGSITEAEDIVQDVFVRWSNTDFEEIKTPEAWLSSVTTRLSIDYLRSARYQRHSYIGPWLPEPLIEHKNEPDASYEIDQTVTMALMVLLDQLSAKERSAYILHDLFSYDFNHIAKILDCSATSCRKLASRSRDKIREQQKQSVSSSEQYKQFIEAFFKAARTDDTEALLQLLNDDVIFYSDGGGKASAARHVLVGKDEVMNWLNRVLTPVFNKWSLLQERRTIEWFNGSPGMVLWQDSKAISAFSFTIDEVGIRQIHVLRNPDKLRFFCRKH